MAAVQPFVTGIVGDGILDDWSWLLKQPHRVVVVTKMGDAFVRDPQGKILFLDTMEGSLQPAADNVDAFKDALQRGTTNSEWLMLGLVAHLEQQGQQLGPGQCFSYTIPPVLGGAIEPTNVEVVDVSVHFSIAGQIHRQVKDLPPGTPVGDVKISD